MAREYCVVFDKKRYKRWWNLFLDDSIYHCFLITPITEESCVEVNVSLGGIRLRHYNASSLDVAREYIHKGATDAVITDEGDLIKPRLKFGRSCVGVIKDFLGIDNIFIITSKQLYNYLRGEK